MSEYLDERHTRRILQRVDSVLWDLFSEELHRPKLTFHAQVLAKGAFRIVVNVEDLPEPKETE